ncbi:hypothetical protein AJ80_06891 [Polytolypa hystricis UAMH7299]|uniref:Uncharacterized protein n=1 Tax=Polytolypa hystricis (strain UAMH7299) TaxID=1447883 RepID=A0A2B7XTV6_POLH7|nr:hypothetical protein AJ80_06891 [Polytolypa hystricis UAMH7299]
MNTARGILTEWPSSRSQARNMLMPLLLPSIVSSVSGIATVHSWVLMPMVTLLQMLLSTSGSIVTDLRRIPRMIGWQEGYPRKDKPKSGKVT